MAGKGAQPPDRAQSTVLMPFFFAALRHAW